jgi:hypothetical protein
MASLVCIAGFDPAHSAEITPQQALQIANSEIRTLTFDDIPPSKSVMPPSTRVTSHHGSNNECMDDIQDRKYRQKIRKALKDRRYFNVFYLPPPRRPGDLLFGVICFFIDRETGEVIGRHASQ